MFHAYVVSASAALHNYSEGFLMFTRKLLRRAAAISDGTESSDNCEVRSNITLSIDLEPYILSGKYFGCWWIDWIALWVRMPSFAGVS